MMDTKQSPITRRHGFDIVIRRKLNWVSGYMFLLFLSAPLWTCRHIGDLSMFFWNRIEYYVRPTYCYLLDDKITESLWLHTNNVLLKSLEILRKFDPSCTTNEKYWVNRMSTNNVLLVSINNDDNDKMYISPNHNHLQHCTPLCKSNGTFVFRHGYQWVNFVFRTI